MRPEILGLHVQLDAEQSVGQFVAEAAHRADRDVSEDDDRPGRDPGARRRHVGVDDVVGRVVTGEGAEHAVDHGADHEQQRHPARPAVGSRSCAHPENLIPLDVPQKARVISMSNSAMTTMLTRSARPADRPTWPARTVKP